MARISAATATCASCFFPCTAEPALYLFGGDNHDVFLGCVNASEYDSKSIWNKYGEYGSRYSSTSIWNDYGEYGGKYSNYSPFNPYASNPPAVVDAQGNFYGYLTANKYNPKRTRIQALLQLVKIGGR